MSTLTSNRVFMISATIFADLVMILTPYVPVLLRTNLGNRAIDVIWSELLNGTGAIVSAAGS